MDSSSSSQSQPETHRQLQDSDFPSGIIKPRHLAASTAMASGDTYFVNSAGIFQRLPAGAAGQVLTLSSGLPAWITPTPVPTVTKNVVVKATLGSDFTTGSVSYVDVTGLAATITTTVTCNILAIVSGSWLNDGLNSNYLKLIRGSTDLCIVENREAAINYRMTLSISYMDLSVAAGTYTYKTQAQVDAGNVDITGGGAGGQNTQILLLGTPV